jgi:YhcH/YjgK/YiaL family protein
MIVDKLENANLYAGISDKINAALEILKDPAVADKADGRYDVDGDNLYYMVQRYSTAPIEEGKIEAHKKYIDIQFVAAGCETIGYAPIAPLEVDIPYDEKGDVVFYKNHDLLSRVKVCRSMFCILLPGDGHIPGRACCGSSDVCKIVVKVRI